MTARPLGLEQLQPAHARLQEAMEDYVEAVLERAGHPVQEFASLRWSGPCGHTWTESDAERVGVPVPAAHDWPPTCPWCALIRQRDQARDRAVAIEHELHALRTIAQEVVDDHGPHTSEPLCNHRPGGCACSYSRLAAFLALPVVPVVQRG